MRNIAYCLFLVLVLSACKKEQEIITPEIEVPVTTFTLTFENVMKAHNFFQSGTTDLIQLEERKTYTFVAGVGMHLSFVTMLLESNDLFYGFEDKGIALYDENGVALTGDITSEVRLWDAGIAINEITDKGNRKTSRQRALHSEIREDDVIQLVDSLKDDLVYPRPDSTIRLSLEHDGNNQFILTIENISSDEFLNSTLSPGVFAIHQQNKQLFKAGEKAPSGFDAMADNGDNAVLWAQVSEETGFTSIIGTGVYIVHKEGNPIFTNGEQDRGQGLETLAEYGNPEILHNVLKADSTFPEVGLFNDPIGNDVLNLGGKLVPGDRYEFSFNANPGDYVSIASMLVETNDLFFAFAEGGLELFPLGLPLNGEVTNKIQLWDSGTESNEFPGAGCFQPLRNGAKESTDEHGVVQPVNDAFIYPAISDLVRVTIKSEN